MKLLVLEDDANLRSALRRGFRRAGHVVDDAGTLEDARWLVAESTYDALVLDVMVPDGDGFGFCRDLRQAGDRTPVLMLTARDAVVDRVRGLDVGADDYLIKPFAMPELLARLRALSRRSGPSRTSELRLGDITLDTVSRKVSRAGKYVELTAIEYSVLEFMMRHPGQVLSRDQIIDHVWNADFDSGSKLIEVYIYHLRRKLDDGHAVKLIHTVRGMGYRMDESESS